MQLPVWLKNWQTTAGGFALLFATLSTVLRAVSDNDPETTVDLIWLVGQLGLAWAAITARDAGKSSKGLGI